MKALVILPTYNEKENISLVIEKVLAESGLDILVVDDNSDDGTREAVREAASGDPRVSMVERPAKLGLGTAYICGFKLGLERGYDCMVEMDSDLSHDPKDLPRFLAEVENGADLAIGSRYMGGKISVVGWDFRRLLLSRFGNIYASGILRAPLTDMTSGFRAFSSRALKSLDLDSISSEGYAFQIEMAYLLWRRGMRVKEIPIVFTERTRGVSKMSTDIVKEAVWLPWRLLFNRATGAIRRSLGLRAEPGVRKWR